MRTTLEIRDEHRGKLLEIAAQRGEKGFSRIVDEALTAFLARREARADLVRSAVEAIGALGEDEAGRIEREAAELRRSWR